MRAMVGCRVPATPTLVAVLNISPAGCLFESENPCISRGSTILMIFPLLGEIAGQVVWRERSRIGVKFNSSLGAGVVAAILSRDTTRRAVGNMKDKFGRDLPHLPRLPKAFVQPIETGPERSFE
jgi:hypothetical protein